VADANYNLLTQPQAYGGAISTDGNSFLTGRLDSDEGSLEVFRQDVGGGFTDWGKPPFDGTVVERLVIDTLADGRVVVVAAVDRPGPDGELNTGRQAMVIDPSGTTKAFAFPFSTGPEDQVRSARMGHDGNLYAMSFDDSGVTVAEVQP
jgi:hypothetical protein